MKPFYISLGICFMMIACGKDKSEVQKKETITIESFTDLPEEIDGCSCAFSEDSVSYAKGLFIYGNDFAKTSFIKIDGKLVRLTETEHGKPDSLTTISKSEGAGYKVEIRATIPHTTDLEDNEMKGSITIKSSKGQTVTKTIYGECGC
nr:hypothetical protein [uncultured Flavobacterium sp.]